MGVVIARKARFLNSRHLIYGAKMKKIFFSIVAMMVISLVSAAWGSEGNDRAIQRIDDLSHQSGKLGRYRA